jgi:hypothetical protein
MISLSCLIGFWYLICLGGTGTVNNSTYPPQPQRSRLLTCQDASRISMATKLDPSEIVSLKELLVANFTKFDGTEIQQL